MADRLRGKVVVVTGAARGIGKGCAAMAANEGANVVLADIEESGAGAAEAIAGAGGSATFVRTDVTDESSVTALIQTAVDTYGRLDGLVNNVGWFPRATIQETSVDLWDQVIAVNLRSAFLCSKYAIPHLHHAGGGSIVNMGSIHGIQGAANVLAYASAKGGLLSMTRTLAGALAPERIRVNYIIPGWVLTEGEIALQLARGETIESLTRAGEALPLGRHQTVEDAAYAAVFLLSDESAQVTGTILNVDAGISMLPLGGAPYPG